jgi:cellulose synthase/poly-beta-1,6-N-acetylglucosamine synthase-like glycosyltransferase
MTLFLIILCASSLAYLAATLFLYQGLKRLHTLKPEPHPALTFSVVIAAHNEEHNLEDCLKSVLNQTIERNRYEVILVDDRSSDRTGEIAQGFLREYPNLSVITITKTPPGIAPKKHAVAQGIAQAHSEIIVFTDADCRVLPTWLSTISGHFGPDAGLVQGITSYAYVKGMNRAFFNLQAIDFLSHGVVAAAAIGAHFPLNSNANNLAFRKAAFEAAGGYGAARSVVSGDDDLLLQRISKNKTWKIRFMTDSRGAVETLPAPTWKALFEQRKRWGSKTVHYNARQIFFLSLIFSFYCLLIMCGACCFYTIALLPVFVCMFLIKLFGEALLMMPGTGLFGKKGLRPFIIPASFIQLPLVVCSVVFGVFGKFGWKGRTFKRTMKNTYD